MVRSDQSQRRDLGWRIGSPSSGPVIWARRTPSCMAELGYEVLGIDIDAAKVETAVGRAGAVLRAGAARRCCARTSHRPAAVHHVVRRGRRVRRRALRLRRHAAEARRVRRRPDATSTPPSRRWPRTWTGRAWSSGKSTVPVGTARAAGRAAARGPRPARGRAGLEPRVPARGATRSQDTLQPDRLVFGVRQRWPTSGRCLREVYAPLIAAGAPVVVTDFATAELVKVAANSFLATKISFINAMAEVCEAAGADVTALADAIGHDARIGRKFLNAGLGFGGGCLPKDIRAFMARGRRARRRPGADASCARSTRSTCAAAHGWSTWPARCCGGSFLGDESRCWARRSSPTPTTCATPPRSTSPGDCTPGRAT